MWVAFAASAINAFPSWFLRITCDRCGEVQLVSKVHSAAWRDRTLRQILAKMRRDGCGGLPASAELLSGADGAASPTPSGLPALPAASPQTRLRTAAKHHTSAKAPDGQT